MSAPAESNRNTPATKPSRILPSKTAALKVALIYAFIGAIWIFGSGWLLHELVKDPGLAATLENVKGWFYVCVTALLLGLALDRYFRKIRESANRIQNNETQIQLIGENLPDSYFYQFTRDTDGTPQFIFISAGVERIHGIAPHELLKDANLLLGQIEPEQRVAYRQQEERSARYLVDFEMELRMKRPDGDIRILHIQSRPRHAEPGQVIWDGFGVDMTDRKRIEDATRVNDLRLQRAELASKSGNWELYLDSKKVIGSRGARKIYGVNEDELTYDIIKTVPLPEYRPLLDTALKNLVEQHIPYDVEFEIKAMDTGEIKNIHSIAVYDSAKNVIFGVIQDITAYKKIEEEKRSSEALFSTVFNASPVAIAITRLKDHTFISVNNAWEQTTGYQRTEVIGKSPIALGLWINPQEREHMIHIVQEKGTVQGYEIRLRQKSGKTIDLLMSAELIRVAGEPCLLTLAIDITENKSAEENMRKLWFAIEQSPVSVVITDTGGSIQYVNRKFSEVTGYAAAEAIGNNPRILKSGLQSATIYQELWDTIKAGKEWRGVFQNVKKNGDIFWEDALISPVIDAKGTITNFLAVKEDITERKKLEAQILRTQRLESLGTLASGIAHDLNNVLSPILLATEILEKRLADPRSSQVLESLRTSAMRGSSIVKQFLTFARGTEEDLSPQQPRYIIREIVSILQETFPKNISVQIDVPKYLKNISANATQFHQVIMNLCINARDAMPQGGTLVIRAKNISIDETYARMDSDITAGEYVVCSVIDTGTGIPKDIQEKIFDPFFTTKEVGKGTGLGLSTVQTIMKSHKGFVKMKSQPGEGTEFDLYFPALESEIPVNETESKEGVPQGHGETILLIDDELSILEICKAALDLHNYNVLTAQNGADAVALFANADKGSIRLVVTDLNMPFMDGPSTIKTLRHLDPDVRIIVASGIINQAADPLHPDLDIQGTLTKPFSAGMLLRKIADVLQQPS